MKVKPKTRPIQTSDLYSSTSFLELKQEWYQKARDAGFEDLEAEDGSLVDEHDEHYAKRLLLHSPGRCEALAEYYTEAERGLASLVFACPEDRAIWAHHARGLSVREIAALLHMKTMTVQDRIAKYRRRLGLKRPR